MNKKTLGFSVLALAAASAQARPGDNIRFADGSIVLKPYVSLTYSYDSNSSSTKHSRDDSVFAVRPGLDFNWNRPDREFNLNGGVWYGYNSYVHQHRDSHSSIGQTLNLTKDFIDDWGNRWSLRLGEQYRKINANDTITGDDGNGIWRDRETFIFSGALSHRLKRFHWGVHGQFSWLDYGNDATKYQKLYGWKSWSAGGELGWMFSRWTDALLTGSYSKYDQERKIGSGTARAYSGNSETWTLQAGIGSHLPDSEKISYRALVGASRHEYGRNNNDTSWTYQLNFNWRFAPKWAFSLRGTSYYQPSEYSYGQSSRTYTLGAGLNYAQTDKLRWTADLLYRKERSVASDYRVAAFDHNYLHARIGVYYSLTKWAQVHGSVAYVTRMSSDDRDNRDYDRFRGTLGLTFMY